MQAHNTTCCLRFEFFVLNEDIGPQTVFFARWRDFLWAFQSLHYSKTTRPKILVCGLTQVDECDPQVKKNFSESYLIFSFGAWKIRILYRYDEEQCVKSVWRVRNKVAVLCFSDELRNMDFF